MPLCQVNIATRGLDSPGDTEAQLRTACAALHPTAPIVVLIHGYKYSPFVDAHDPHALIFARDPRPCWKAVSWPRRLGLGQTDGPEPLFVALGWEARGSLWQAYARAAAVGEGLAQVIALLSRIRPGQRVSIFAHSLGGRVALAALPHLDAGTVGHIVLLAAAEMQSSALRWLDCPAGRTAGVLNVRSRENAVFDRLLEILISPHFPRDRAVGAGLPGPAGNWMDMAVDDPATRAALSDMGFRIPAPDRRICHWSVYLRSGLFDVYRALLAGDLPLSQLRAALPQATQPDAPRRRRLQFAPLPLARRGAS